MKNKRAIIDPQVVALAKEQCLLTEPEIATDGGQPFDYVDKVDTLTAWLVAIEADLEAQQQHQETQDV
jgi:hypothetical protein